MIRLLHIIIIFVICFYTNSACASEETHIEFLENMLRSDFQGDCSTRTGRIVYSDPFVQDEEQYKRGQAAPIDGYYQLDDGGFFLVKDYKIRNAFLNYKSYCSFVVFTVVGVVKEYNFKEKRRPILIFKKQQKKHIEYCVLKIDGKWMLVDTHIPMVGISPVINDTEKRIKSLEEQISSLKNTAHDNETKIFIEEKLRGSLYELKILKNL